MVYLLLSSIKWYVMKLKLSVSMEDKTVEMIDRVLLEGLFRNKSHLVEYAVKKMLGGKS